MPEIKNYKCRILNQDFLDKNRLHKGAIPSVDVLIQIDYSGKIYGILCDFYNKDGTCNIKKENEKPYPNLECVVKEGFKEIK